MSVIDILPTSDITLLEVAELAAASNVVLIERAGRIALCGAQHVPEGWHRCAVAQKNTEQHPC